MGTQLKILSSIMIDRTLKKLVFRTWIRNAVNLSYKIVGESTLESDEPPIILLHGLLGRKKHWRGIGKTIFNMTKRTVAIVDLRNHGGSPYVNSHKYDELAADVLQLMDKLQIESASLVGHSMGGRTAMCLSLLVPKRVAGLLVVDISPVSTAPEMFQLEKLMLAMKELDFTKSKQVTRAKKYAKTALRDFISDDNTLEAILSCIYVNSGGRIDWMFNLDILLKHFNYIATFPKDVLENKYDGPCLFIGGQLSDYIPADDLPMIRDLFPRAVVTYIPKAGHNLHVEEPRSFLELAISFLKNNH